MRSSGFNLLFLLGIPALAFASSGHDQPHRRSQLHHGRAKVAERQDGGPFSGRATFFDVGLGACGDYNVASDFIVALNTPQYGYGSPGPECFLMITIQYNGITQTAQIMDECPSCNYGDLDMSRGLFDSFASEDLGEFQMTWWYNNNPPSQPTSTTPAWTPPPTTSTTPAWTPPPTTSTTPTSTWVAPTTTSTSTTPTSTATSSSSASSSSSTGSLSATDDADATTLSVSLPAATPSVTAGSPNNAATLNDLVVAYGNLIAQGPVTSS